MDFDSFDAGTLKFPNVYIEVFAGSLAKYELHKGKLKADRKIGIPFPFPYGFIPKTVSGDNDPLDVFLISKTRSRVVKTKVLGVIKMTDDGKTDNKIILASVKSKKLLSGVGNEIRKICMFLISYKKGVDILGIYGVQSACDDIRSAREKYKNSGKDL